jgi:hypothetical protein
MGGSTSDAVVQEVVGGTSPAGGVVLGEARDRLA